MKKALKTVGVFLILGLALVGCKKESAEDLAKKTLDQMANAKYMDTNIEASIGAKASGQEMKITMSGKLQYDISGELPELLYDGKMGMNGLDLSLVLHMDQQNTTVSMMGQTQTTPLSEAYKNTLKEAIQKAKETPQNNSISYTPTLEKSGSEKILTLNYDTAALNTYLQKEVSGQELATMTDAVEKSNVEKMQVVYTLDGKNTIKKCDIILDMKLDGDENATNIIINLTVNSIDQKLDIQAPSTQSATNNAA